MSTIPQIQEHPPPTTDTRASTPDSPKSRIRSFFHWRRPSNVSLRPNTRSGDECAQQISSSGASTLRRPSTPRKGIEVTQAAASSRTSSPGGPLTRKQGKLLADPPPLAQVHRQALLHATLETPSSYTDKIRKRRGSTGEYSPREIAEHAIEVKRSHKRTASGESTCSTCSKTFFLINGPYLLQYVANGEGDALPEKILVLDKDCVAFACDVVPGRPWVLQVSKTSGSPTKPQAQTLKPTWSRLTLRQNDDKRIVNTMLLVFDDSEELYTWLFAVRKEIEELGGIEYRPDAEHDDQTWRENLTKKFATTYEIESNTQEEPVIDPMSSIASSSALNGFQNPEVTSAVRPFSARSNGSSKKTSTSLDRLRDSMTSDGHSSTLATSSADGSAPSTSPTCEHFPSIKSVTEHANKDLSLRAFSMSSGSIRQQSRSPLPSKGGILERRKLSMSSLQLIAQVDPVARKALLDLPSTISGSPNDDALSLKSPIQASPKLNTLNSTSEPISAPTVEIENAMTLINKQQSDEKSKTSSSRKPSVSEPTSGGNKAKYSLFPSRIASENKPEPFPSAPLPALVSAQPKVPRITKTVVDEPAKLEPKHRKSRSRTVTLELRQHRVSALLALGEFDVPQRSPAVTDDMIMSNFGMARNEPPPSPMPLIKVPGLYDLNMDLDFLKTPYQEQAKRTSSVSGNKRASSTRSISSVHSDAAAIAKTPLGPPPAGPLPAVPKIARVESKASRSSQQNRFSHHKTSQSNGRDTPSSNNSTKQNATSPLHQTTFSPYSTGSSDVKVQSSPMRHRRTISSSLDGPPAPIRMLSQPSIETLKDRSRSRSRGRPKSSRRQT